MTLPQWEVQHGDCLALMRELADASVDAVVCDPPAGIAFMSKDWDKDKGGRDAWIAWLASVMREALRVMKPGAHALVWALPRTSHWTGMALEDAGFEVRDCITHLFGSGFPKSLAVNKALDKAAGAEREVIGPSRIHSRGGSTSYPKRPGERSVEESGRAIPQTAERAVETAPATDLARQWAGWGTALKPAAEFWFLCRKPIAASNIAANVAQFGTGALNIDGCRIGHANAADRAESFAKNPGRSDLVTSDVYGAGRPQQSVNAAGRWPANVVLSHTPECREVGTRRVKGSAPNGPNRGAMGYHGSDVQPGREPGYADPDGLETVTAWDCAPGRAVRLLDEQSRERGMHSAGSAQGRQEKWRRNKTYEGWGNMCDSSLGFRYGDTGGASRFYYTAKSSRRERNAGLPEGETNGHPTVKSLELMKWLVRLVTPPDGLVLDPFCGSGSTGCAAVLEGFRFLGMDQSEEYCELARRRIAHWAEQPREAPQKSGKPGRWPPNVVLDREAARQLDEMSGERPTGGPNLSGGPAVTAVYEGGAGRRSEVGYGDTGGASRYMKVIDTDAPDLFAEDAA